MLYKYLSKERIGFWENFLLRFTQPSAFNDPYDCLSSYSWLPEHLMPGNAGYQDIAALFYRLEEDSSFFNDHLAILCLSEIYDSILMWSHYAENHSGFVIGFDTSHPFFAFNEILGTNPVQYCPARPQSKPSELQNEYYYKLDVWSYEREWRLCKEASKADKQLGDVKQPVYLYRLPPESIQCVYFGIRTPEEMKQAIFAKAAVLNVPCFQMMRHYQTYALSVMAYEDYLTMQRINKRNISAP